MAGYFRHRGSPPGRFTMLSQNLEKYLKRARVPYEIRKHPATMTAGELAQRENVDGHQVAKVVVVREKGRYFMLVIPASYFVDLEMAREITGHPRLHLATEPELHEIFPDCDVGAMPPLGNLYNLPVYLEKDLTEDGEIEFNGGSHEEAVRMKFNDYMNITHPKVLHFAKRWREFL